VPVEVLTKRTGIDLLARVAAFEKWDKSLIALGFTLTGHDEMEPGASTNAERIEAMRKLHKEGFKTWASIEPVIDFESSWRMISQTLDFCDLYKIGLESGKKYNTGDLKAFIYKCEDYIGEYDAKIYFKDSLLKQAGVSRSELPDNCVDRDYNLFHSNLEKEKE
jgi:DNA repair photolyase